MGDLFIGYHAFWMGIFLVKLKISTNELNLTDIRIEKKEKKNNFFAVIKHDLTNCKLIWKRYERNDKKINWINMVLMKWLWNEKIETI